MRERDPTIRSLFKKVKNKKKTEKIHVTKN